ncbi:urease accessory protein UreF [Verrucomicrobiota bacterium sgz303538]
MTGELSWLPYLLQTADALFPTGAYAHSLGFEEVVRLGVVRDETSLSEFLRLQIVPALERHELPYLRFAAAAAQAASLEHAPIAFTKEDGEDAVAPEGGRPRPYWRLRPTCPLDELCALDREISAWKLARETREASTQLGTRRLKALRVISNSQLIDDFENSITEGKARGHHLVVCGIQSAIENVPMHAALTAYYFQSHSSICSAALKLIRIGQDGCQRVLRTACLGAEQTIHRSLAVERNDAGWFNPLLEIASMRHERADERLFIS